MRLRSSSAAGYSNLGNFRTSASNRTWRRFKRNDVEGAIGLNHPSIPRTRPPTTNLISTKMSGPYKRSADRQTVHCCSVGGRPITRCFPAMANEFDLSSIFISYNSLSWIPTLRHKSSLQLEVAIGGVA